MEKEIRLLKIDEPFVLHGFGDQPFLEFCVLVSRKAVLIGYGQPGDKRLSLPTIRKRSQFQAPPPRNSGQCTSITVRQIGSGEGLIGQCVTGL